MFTEASAWGRGVPSGLLGPLPNINWGISHDNKYGIVGIARSGGTFSAVARRAGPMYRSIGPYRQYRARRADRTYTDPAIPSTMPTTSLPF